MNSLIKNIKNNIYLKSTKPRQIYLIKVKWRDSENIFFSQLKMLGESSD